MIYRAAWVLPMSAPPIRNGWVQVRDGVILDVGAAAAEPPAPADEVVDLGFAVVLPGLVNAHTHLELSWLTHQVAPRASMPEWVRDLMARRRQAPVPAERQAAAAAAAAGCWRAGTAVVADVANTLDSCAALAESPLESVIFYELLGFKRRDADAAVEEAVQTLKGATPGPRSRIVLSAHAPYSVAPELLCAIHRAPPAGAPFAIHLAESAEEVEFLQTGCGAWREVLEDVGSWRPDWRPPVARPVEYLDALGLVDDRLVAVHGVQLTDEELSRLAGAGATVVTCPRSNQWTGAGIPPVERFFGSGVAVAIGTDSLASCPDLSIFEELRELRRLAPRVPASSLLRSATLTGARALRLDHRYGSISRGRAARLLVVPLPAGEADVEEYLVSEPVGDRLAWLPAAG